MAKRFAASSYSASYFADPDPRPRKARQAIEEASADAA